MKRMSFKRGRGIPRFSLREALIGILLFELCLEIGDEIGRAGGNVAGKIAGSCLGLSVVWLWLQRDKIVRTEYAWYYRLGVPCRLRPLHWREKQQTASRIGSAFVQVALLCLTGGAFSLFLNGLLTVLSSCLRNLPWDVSAQEEQIALALWPGLLLYGLLAPLAEELVFRKMLTENVQKLFTRVFLQRPMVNRLVREDGSLEGMPPIWAALAGGILFGLVHGNLLQIVYAACFGTVIGWIYLKSRRFYQAVLLHSSANVIIFLGNKTGFIPEYPSLFMMLAAACCTVVSVFLLCRRFAGDYWSMQTRGQQ